MAKHSCCFRFFHFVLSYIIGPLCTPIACLLAPLYRSYDAWTFEWFQNRHVSTLQEHKRKVARIQDQVRAWKASGSKNRMCTAKPLWNSYNVHGINKRNLAQIDVNELNCVVEVDTTKRVVTMEPGVMMGQLTTILIPRGWTIPVVPEFETLTVGGVFCGTGIESNSGRYGLSPDTALEYEVVLSNGNVVTCSKEENSDLFHSIPWSHGTLGFLTAVKMPLIPAKKYVQLEYHSANTIQEVQRLLECQDHEFVEGIAYGPEKFMVTYGNMSDRPDPRRGPVNHMNRWYKPFFYKHVESFFGKRAPASGGKHVDYIPLRDYYHRHTRAIFWGVPIAFPYINNALFLFFFGGNFPPNTKLGRRMLAATGLNDYGTSVLAKDGVVQDFLVPLQHLKPMFDLVHETVQIYPLWLCPCKFFKKRGLVHCSGDAETEIYVDVGIYGRTHRKKLADFHPEHTTRIFEAFCLDHSGVQFLYADTFLSHDEFRKMFDLSLYDKVRAKYECLDAFPDVYDKVSKAARRIQV